MIWNFFTIVSEYAGADESIEHLLRYFQVTHSQSAFISEWLLEQKFPSVCLAKPGCASCVPYTLFQNHVSIMILSKCTEKVCMHSCA